MHAKKKLFYILHSVVQQSMLSFLILTCVYPYVSHNP